MFIGHFGLAFGAKKAAPAVSLGSLFLACQLADLLWFSIPATLAVEFVLFGAGLAVYLRATSAHDRIGSIGLWTLVAFLLIIYLAAAFGPPPPSATAVAWSAQALWLLVVWGYWVDNHRMRHRNT